MELEVPQPLLFKTSGNSVSTIAANVPATKAAVTDKIDFNS